MKESNNVFDVGVKVLSTDFGIGFVSAIEKLQEGGDDFYVIEHGDKNMKNFYPTVNNKKLRKVSSEDEFEKVLKLLKSSRKVNKIDSKKDRDIYFCRPLEKDNINKIMARVCELAAVETLVPKEQKILDRLVDSIILEDSIIFQKTLKESRDVISKFL